MDELTEQFIIFSKLFRRYTDLKHQKIGKYGNFLRGQGRILAVLDLKPLMSQKELIRVLSIRPQSLGELLRKLEKSALIQRFPSKEDRRIMMIELTEKGAAAAKKISESHNIELFQHLTSAERTQLISILGKLSNVMRADLPETAKDGPYCDDPWEHLQRIKEIKEQHDRE
ncbi:MarR family transcriptional regulator [Ligilactobacillus salitolerans]|uniref:MarR family transcriptional regulator n=1 Tax=Ligilactobacillus salitolerans TaxID=1808352 RepID=A0A401IQL1_9LACO|nr:MarR family transcriptional regulator [Ligilactobacillus salitolerans]GBG93803.1 MarR family transcriptional regulator [Ligilactobacillus salitolerans]